MKFMAHQVQKTAGRSKRRQPRKGFPHRVVAYLDEESKRLVDAALKLTGENTSMFTAKALVQRSEKVLREQGEINRSLL
jgi:uncharacterized protein (DUF1778 family)